MPLSDWIDDLTVANARVKSETYDNATGTYMDTTGPDFPVGYHKLSSTEINRLGREYGTEIYILLADLKVDGSAPVGKSDTLNVDRLGDLNVVAVIPYEQPDERICRIEAEVTK